VRFLIFANPGKITRRVDDFHTPQTPRLCNNETQRQHYPPNHGRWSPKSPYRPTRPSSVKRWSSRYFDAVFLAVVRKKTSPKNIEGNMEENLVDLESKSRRFPSIFSAIFFGDVKQRHKQNIEGKNS
jgi:hypothetical protein